MGDGGAEGLSAVRDEVREVQFHSCLMLMAQF